jgi:hypothetical protein
MRSSLFELADQFRLARLPNLQAEVPELGVFGIKQAELQALSHLDLLPTMGCNRCLAPIAAAAPSLAASPSLRASEPSRFVLMERAALMWVKAHAHMGHGSTVPNTWTPSTSDSSRSEPLTEYSSSGGNPWRHLSSARTSA